MKLNRIKKILSLFFIISVFVFFTLSYFFPVFLLVVLFGLGPLVIGVFLWDTRGGVLVTALLSFVFVSFCLPENQDIALINFAFALAAYFAITITVKLIKVITKLKISEERYKKVVEKANDGIIIIQKDIIKYNNSKIGEILGYNPKEIINTNFRKYIAQQEIDKISSTYQEKTRKEKKPLVYEIILKHKNGGPVYTEINTSSINYENEPAELVIIRDVTQRKQVEDILHQREQEFKILVENAPDIIARFDNEFRCLYVNSKTQDELGIAPEKFFWKNLKEIGISKEAAETWEEALVNVFRRGKDKTIYIEQETPSGLKYYQIRLLPEYNKDNKIRTVLSIARDITEIKEIDKIKSEFVSIASHQIRTPLSIIRWCSSALLDGNSGDLNEDQKNYIENIYSASKKMIRSANAFLNVAILDMGFLNINPKFINFTEIANESLNDFDSLIKEKEIKIIKKYEKDMPQIKTDPRLLKIIFSGLISNSITYNDKGGSLLIEIKTKEDNVLVKIADDGWGIQEKDKNNIFSKFFRGQSIKEKEAYGIGLDLYIIKSIINNFNGEIYFQSPNPEFKDKGTVFFFMLPKESMGKKKGENVII